MVLTELRLEEVSHLCQFSLALRLQAFDKVGHLQVVIFSNSQFISKIIPNLIRSLLLLLHHIEFAIKVSQHGGCIVELDREIN